MNWLKKYRLQKTKLIIEYNKLLIDHTKVVSKAINRTLNENVELEKGRERPVGVPVKFFDED